VPNYPQAFAIREKLLILCEGPHDRAFLRALLRQYRITGFQTTDPTDLGEQRGGHTYWPQSLNRIVAAPKAETLRGIVIMGDNDTSPAARFASIAKAVAGTDAVPATQAKLPVPQVPGQIAPGPPSVMALMIPATGQTGNLETLCLGPARTAARSPSD
jgi:hypothetical protein